MDTITRKTIVAEALRQEIAAGHIKKRPTALDIEYFAAYDRAKQESRRAGRKNNPSTNKK